MIFSIKSLVYFGIRKLFATQNKRFSTTQKNQIFFIFKTTQKKHHFE
jgi:hypothetical protein